MTVQIVDMGAGDLVHLVALIRSVAWSHRPEDLQQVMELGHGKLARDGASGEAVGVAFWWPHGESAATLGLVIVAPDRQGQGIGRRLMQALLAEIGERHVMLHATDAGAPLYEKLGFRAVGRVRQLNGTVTASPSPDAAVRPLTANDRDRLVALDAAAFGAPRVGLIDLLLRDGIGFGLGRGGELVGYAFRRDFGRGEVVGPIVAEDQEDAIALFDAARRPGFLRADIPADAEILRRHLADAGLETVSEVVVMVRGERPRIATTPVRFGLFSQALG